MNFLKIALISVGVLSSACTPSTGKLAQLNIPSWVATPYEDIEFDKYISGVGFSAKPQIGEDKKVSDLKYLQMQIDEASLHAKANISEQIATEITKDNTKNVSKNSTTNGDTYEDSFKQEIKEKINQKLFGVKRINTYMSKEDDTIFVRLVIEKSKVKEVLKTLDAQKYSSSVDNIGKSNNN
jgi:hypothetical protein